MNLRKLCAALILAGATAAAAQADPEYRMVVVDAPAPFLSAYGHAVNDAGDLVGRLTSQDGSSTFFHRWAADGAIRYIPVPGSGRISALNDINNARQIIGTSTAGAFRWSESEGWLTIAPPPGYTHPQPLELSRDGQVVGYVFQEYGGLPETEDRKRLFFWNARDGMQILHPQRRVSSAAVNSRGQIAATSIVITRRYRQDAILLDAANGITLLSPSTQDGSGSEATAINDAGYVTGTAGGRGMLWSPAGDAIEMQARPIGLSNRGEVLFNGAVWTQHYGFRRINKYLAAGSPFMKHIGTTDISDNGVVAGAGKNGPYYHALIFTPSR
jgi:hypothetical protein